MKESRNNQAKSFNSVINSKSAKCDHKPKIDYIDQLQTYKSQYMKKLIEIEIEDQLHCKVNDTQDLMCTICNIDEQT